MEHKYEIIDIEAKELLNYVYELKEEGYRLVQISCTRLSEINELNYSFALGYNFINLKIQCGEEEILPSISSIFQPAFLYENEMKDLFAIKLKHISIDYEGHLYKLSKKTPFVNSQEKEGK